MLHARDDYQGRIVEIETNGTKRQIPDDEPVFLLRGQDQFAARTVRRWAQDVEECGGDPAIVAAARRQADLMDAWPKKKIPDMPGG